MSNLRQAQSMYDKLDAFGFTLRSKGEAVRNIPALADRIGMAVYKLAEIKL